MRVFSAFLMGFALSAQAAPFYLGADGKPLATERTVCQDKWVKMTTQDDGMQKLGMPIGIYRAKMSGGTAMCSGTLVDKDLFLTAAHCYESECSNISVTFGYLQDRFRQETFRCSEVVEKGSSGADDYLLIRLEGSPGAAWGYYPLSDQELEAGQSLLMIHHPGGRPMMVSQEGCKVYSVAGGYVNHRCDTEGGSSGGGILLPDYERPENTRVVGVHTLGGCNESATSYNSGPSIHHLAASSEVLKSLVRK